MLDKLNMLFYINLKRILIEEELDSFGEDENGKPIDIIKVLDEHFLNKKDS